MRSHIRWLFSDRDEISYLIKNNENNENWPNSFHFIERLNRWQKKLNEQQEDINKIELNNNKIREILADIQTWFINEYNLFGKPAKLALLEKEKEHYRLTKELKVNQRNLDNPKLELEDYEKECLKNKVKVLGNKIESCKVEMEELGEVFQKEKRELCKRLSYTREDLEPFLRGPEEYIDPLTRKLVISSEHYHKWWRKFRDIHPESEPLAKLNELITKWYNFNGENGPELNPHEIYVEEKTNDSLVFAWKPVEEELTEKNDEGKEIKKKGVFLSMLKNYLFNYYGEWYEVSDYEQVGYDLIVIKCERSIFYNDYLKLIMCSANVILHHSPLSYEEICSCPNSEHYSSWATFVLDYELNLELYRMADYDKRRPLFSKCEMDPNNIFRIKDGELPGIVHVPTRTSPREELRNFRGFFGNWFEKGIVYFLLGKSFDQNIFSKSTFFITDSYKEREIESIKSKEKELENKGQKFKPVGFATFKSVSAFDEEGRVTNLGESLTKFLETQGLLKDEMYHFLKDHVKVTLYWRQNPIWRGPYWILHNHAYVTETIGSDGNCVTVSASGLLLNQVKELVTIKPGSDNSNEGEVFMKTIIGIASTAASTIVPGTKEIGEVAVAGIKAGIGLAAGMSQMATNILTKRVPYQENFKTMSIYEFKHKYWLSGNRPLSAKIEFSRELANQYLNKKELKGPMLYTYANFERFGKVLSQTGLLKASVVSWNMTRNSNWFREKIENQVYLYENNHLEFYRKELTPGKKVFCKGGINICEWSELAMEKEYKKVKEDLITCDTFNLNYGNDDYIGSPDNTLWDQMWSQMPFGQVFQGGIASTHFGNSPIPNQCLGCLCSGGSHGKEANYSFEFTYNLTVGGKIHLKTAGSGLQTCRVPESGGKVTFWAKGNSGGITLEYQLSEIKTIKNRSETNPASIPPTTQLPIDPFQANPPETTPFNPNRFPQSGNLMSNPTGSGEPEFNIPDIEVNPDPDFGQDPDIGQDPDPTIDPDKPTDPDIPPDIPPDDPDDPD